MAKNGVRRHGGGTDFLENPVNIIMFIVIILLILVFIYYVYVWWLNQNKIKPDEKKVKTNSPFLPVKPETEEKTETMTNRGSKDKFKMNKGFFKQ
jgi:flagellar basal body-associated protein FliL